MKVQEAEKSCEGIILKELTKHLKYALLGEKNSQLVIIATDLTLEKEKNVVETLKMYKEAISRSMEDLKWISSSICMHTILMEENGNPSIEHQRRLNLMTKEVARKEVLKWLNVVFIFVILDSPWVSPIHVVPKKSGFIGIINEKNELIPIRTVIWWRMRIDYRKLNTATRMDHYPLPFIDHMLDRLAGHTHYCFLNGYFGYNQIAIAPAYQEKTTFTCPCGTFAFRSMTFGLCKAPTTLQRCMMSIFSNLGEEVMEIFMDDFSVFWSSFEECLHNLAMVL